MDWRKKIIDSKNQKTRSWNLLKIKIIRNNKIFYSIKWKNSIKTGIIGFHFMAENGRIRKELYRPFSMVGIAALILITSYFSIFHNPNLSKKSEPGIGGVGDISSADKISKNESDDELKKDQLLNSDEEEVVNDSSLTSVKRTYIVQNGDTLSEIAKKYSVSVEAIAGSSNMQMLDQLHIGQVLYIPSKEGFFYSVRKGDRLAQILNKYNVDNKKFLNENPEISLDLLEAGDEIFLPEAKPDNLIRSWLLPVNTRIVTSSYGWRTYPRRAFHKGLDLKANYTSVRVARAGYVTYAGWLGGYGKVIVVSHSGGYKSLYAHLSKIYVKKGASIAQGTTIAQSGDTGYSFGPHLHFEVSYHGKNINPASLLTGLRYKHRSR